MDDGRPSTREWEGETWRRGHYGVGRTNGNGVTYNQGKNARGGWSQFNGVLKDMERACGIRIATLNIRSGRARGL